MYDIGYIGYTSTADIILSHHYILILSNPLVVVVVVVLSVSVVCICGVYLYYRIYSIDSKVSNIIIKTLYLRSGLCIISWGQ